MITPNSILNFSQKKNFILNPNKNQHQNPTNRNPSAILACQNRKHEEFFGITQFKDMQNHADN